ncbi:GNAT family N-acetyltransferase [Pseudarthrobacter sp. S9]|uniref:GNAT family N-acetyltransferase n=1 Tax=Pseudarthrobacter sp. S9 TaxID=3418421 RepID=UPI003D008DC5
MTTAPYLIEPLVLPAALDAPDAGDFLEFGALCDALVLQIWGNLDRSETQEARLQFWRDTPYTRLRLFFVRQGGRMVASSIVQFWLQENVRLALVRVDVLAEFAGRGFGAALLRHAEALAASEGRTILQSYTEHPADFDPEDPGLIRPATGSGGLPAEARGVRFALAAGYRLEQVERFSALELPPAAAILDELQRDAMDIAGEPYELLHWTDRCPDEYAGQLAVLMSRMSTDAPSGGLSYEEETWDVARVRHVEDTWKQAGLDSLVAAARHLPSGELAAYSVLQVSDAKPWLASQDDTLVAASHRGHRLGMLIKILNLRRLLAGYPAVQRVTTFNAAENDHMLAINIALGFRPAGYDGEWQRAAATDGAVVGE